ncbi:MAG: hypothetical protein RL042_2099 [Nitrospirota bacterium]
MARWNWVAGISLYCIGCAADMPPVVDLTQVKDPLVFGRVVAVITGETSRMYKPEVRFFDVEDQQSHARFNVEIKSEDRHFAISLPAGDYRINRVQISEGPFMSMAQLSAEFSVERDEVTYLGTWRFGVGSPGYGRMVALSMVMDPDERSQADTFLSKQYSTLHGVSVTATLPKPSTVETRLYEVMPYPRYPRYFQRHVW